MLHEVVNYKVKGTRPRGTPRTTLLKSMDNLLKEKLSSMKDVMYQDRRAWRTLFVDGHEFLFLTGDWLETKREVGNSDVLFFITIVF